MSLVRVRVRALRPCAVFSFPNNAPLANPMSKGKTSLPTALPNFKKSIADSASRFRRTPRNTRTRIRINNGR